MNTMNRYFTLLAILFLTNFSYAQNNTGMIVMEMESALLQPGDSVCLNLSGAGFADVLGMQFSIKWDPNVLEFEDVTNLNLPAMTSSDFGLRFIDDGILTFAYIAPTGTVLPDFSTFFSLCLRAKGAAGSSTSVQITSSPTAIEFVGDIDNVAQVITNYSLVGGTVTIPGGQEPAEPLSLNLTGDPLSNCLIEGVAHIDVEATGGQAPYMYLWNGPGGLVASGTSMTPLRAGTYLLQVTDNQGAQLEASFSVFESDLKITGSSITAASCLEIPDGQLSITTAGGKGDLSYRWNTGETTTLIDELPSGDYRVTVSDIFGCATARELTVEAGPGVALSPQTIPPTCGDTDGAVTLNAASPDGNLTYNWSDGGSGDARSGLAPGDYAVTATDAKGCTAEESFDFNWEPLTATLTADCAPNTVNQIEYTAVTNAQGGTGPYTFAWSTGDQESQPAQSSLTLPGAGNYTVTVSDAEACTQTVSIDLPVCGHQAPVWPGDTDNDRFVSHYDLLNIGLGFDQQGPIREQASTAWIAQPSVFWGDTTPVTGLDLKYADTDGNGRIEAADTVAIVQHWGQNHDEGGFSPLTSPPSENMSLYVEPATIMAGQLEAFNIMLGENDGQVVPDAYGLAFQIVYDSLAILSESVEVSFAGSWLGDPGTELLTLQRNQTDAHRIDIAMTRIDHAGRTGSGAVAQLVFQTSDAMPPNDDGAYNVPFRVEQVRLIDPTEQVIAVTPGETSALLMLATSVNNPALERKVQLFPNPARDFLHIEAPQLQLQRIDLLLPNGQYGRSWTGQERLELNGYPAGAYWVRIVTDEGVLTKKVIIMR